MKLLYILAFFVAVATVHVVPGLAQSTVIGQFTGTSLTWKDGSPNPCLQSGRTDEVCTLLRRGGPNNATYIAGFTILDREHIINVGIADIGTQLTVEVDGRMLWLDDTVQMTSLVQSWHFPSQDGNVLNVSWERYNNYHAAPSVNFTAKAATYTVWLNYEQQGRPPRLAKSDDRPVVMSGPADRVNPTATGFAGRAFEVSDLDSGSIYCLLTSPFHQVAAKIVKAGPTNTTVYMTGISFIYKEHQILTEVNNDGSGIILTVNGEELKLDNGWYEDSWTYACAMGGSVSVLWQLYRPLLGNTVEIVTDLLRVMIWLVPARSENMNVNVPPYLNAETTVLQDLNDTGYFQGMLGETYDRYIVGDAIKSRTDPMHLPDDNKFHGLGTRSQYKMDNYWDTNHTFNLYNVTEYPAEVLKLREQKNFPMPSATLFQDALNFTNSQPYQEPKQVDARRLAIVLGVLLSALLLSSCLCFVVGYHRNNIRRAFLLPRQLSASLKLPLHYERHTDEQKK
ncbi:g6710 [Coccomyxa elongata]